MPSDVEYSPVGEGPGPGGEGPGLRDFWLYVWLRRAALIAAHATSAGLTVVICVLSRPGTSLFSWHPVCMSVAYGVFMTQGVLLFHAEGSPFCVSSRRVKARLHLLLQLLALAFSAVGVGFMAASRSVSALPHLSSWHALLGAATLAACGLQAAGGVRLFLHLPAPPPRLRRYHATGGLLLYLLATAAVMAAACSDWLQASVSAPARWALLLLPLGPALVAMSQLTDAHLPRKRAAR